MFQLIYLTFTAPRADPVAFGVMTANLKRMLANQEAEPEAAFSMALTLGADQRSPARPPADAGVRRSDEPRQVAGLLQGPLCRRQRLHVRVRRQLRPRDDEAAGRALPRQSCRRCAGREAAEGRRHPSAGLVVKREVRKGSSRRARSSIVFIGPFQNNEAHRVLRQHDGGDAGGNLHGTLREDLGGTYGVSVEPTFGFRPIQEYRVTSTSGATRLAWTNWSATPGR